MGLRRKKKTRRGKEAKKRWYVGGTKVADPKNVRHEKRRSLRQGGGNNVTLGVKKEKRLKKQKIIKEEKE